MKIKVVVHEAEEGGFWAEVPAIPGCATQGETFEELLENLYDHTLLHRPTWFPQFEIGVFVALGLLLIWAVPRWKPRNSALLVIACVVLVAATAFALFRLQRLLFDAATPARRRDLGSSGGVDARIA